MTQHQAENGQAVTMTVTEFREHIEHATRRGMALALAEIEGYARELQERFGLVISPVPQDPPCVDHLAGCPRRGNCPLHDIPPGGESRG